MKGLKLTTLLVVLVLLFSLASCNKLHLKKNNNNKENQDNVGGEIEETPVTYVYSVLSKTIHLSDCYHIDRMNEDYKFEVEGDVNQLIAKGYTLCKDCLAPDVEDEPEEEEDNTPKIPIEEATYAVNTSSKTFHHLECHHVSVIADKNLDYTDLSADELMADEYKPCSVCLPDEAKEYETTHPEEEK